jgi:hypothetical protein
MMLTLTITKATVSLAISRSLFATRPLARSRRWAATISIYPQPPTSTMAEGAADAAMRTLAAPRCPANLPITTPRE